MQEDKEQVFDVVDTLKKSLLVVEPMLRTMKVNRNAMAEGAKGGFTNATDLADYLAKKSVPFREAHEIVGHLVLFCSKRGCGLEDLTLKEFQEFSLVFEADLFESIGIEYCVRHRSIAGGPAPESVRQAIGLTEKALEEIIWG